MVGKVTPDTMLSASRLPAVFGLSPYATANQELQRSIAALDGAELEPFQENEAMAWGNKLERVILLEAAERLQLNEVEWDYKSAMFHPDDVPLCCSLDGTGYSTGRIITTDPGNGIYVIGRDSIVLEGVGVLEAKLTSHFPEDAPALHRGPLQLQAQMSIMGAKWGAVCVLYQGTELRVFVFAPDPEIQKMIIAKAWEFDTKLTNYHATGDVDWYPAQDAEDSRLRYPTATEEVKELPDDAELHINALNKAEADIEDAKARKDAATVALQEMLGSASEGQLGAWRVKWPMRSYKAQPEKITPAKAAYTIRQSTISVKEVK